MTTPRLTLRGHEPGDLDALATMWAEPAVVEHIIGRPSTRSQTWLRMLSYAGHWAFVGYGYWAAIETASGRVIGEGGFANFERGLDERMDGVPELGFALASHWWGRGYGIELASALVAWGDGALGAAETVCLVDEGNVASRRVLDRVGYVSFAAREINGRQSLLCARERRSP